MAIMKRYIIVILLLTLFLPFYPNKQDGLSSAAAQFKDGDDLRPMLIHYSYIFRPGNYYLLNGASIYPNANFNDEPLGFINIHEEITILELENIQNQQVINSIASHWYLIMYKNIKGYIWGGNIAAETIIFDIDNNGINDYFQYRIAQRAANTHFNADRDVVIYINNIKISVDNLHKQNLNNNYGPYSYTHCRAEFRDGNLFIELSGNSIVSTDTYNFRMDKNGNIEFIDNIKYGMFWEDGEWVVYGEYDPYY